ncbi:MAG TPA: cytochrome c biogenesis protein ResB [Candidatus Hypogeohydataceae bacterium YC40]
MRSLLYDVFSSTKTSIVLFGILLLFYLVGNVLPYGGDYEQIKVTGLALKIIRGLDLLNVYSGPYFLGVVGLFFINLCLCTYKRFLWILKIRQPALLSVSSLSAHKDTVCFQPPYGPEEAVRRIERFFKNRLFFQKPAQLLGEAQLGGVFEQGFIHYVWLSLSYHISVIIAVIGAVITFLFAFESTLTIYPGEPVEVATVSKDIRWNKYIGAETHFEVPPEAKFKLGRENFSITYTQKPSIENFPAKGFGPRLKESLKPGGLIVSSAEDAFYAVEYASRIVVYSGGRPGKEVTVKVNEPLRYRGLTFYQSAYDYRFDLLANGVKVEPDASGKYMLPGVEGEFTAQQVVSGTLLLKDGSKCIIRPFVKLAYMGGGPATPGEGKPASGREVFKIYEGERKEIKGVQVEVGNIKAGTVLSYRHDPGVPLLWIAAPVLFFGMLFRAWGRWLRTSYIVQKIPEGSQAYVQVQRAGIFGGEVRMMGKLRHTLEG